MREMMKGDLSVHNISKQQKITAQYCRRLYIRFANTPLYKIRLLQCGRKPTLLTDVEANAIKKVRYEYPTTGAVSIENPLSHEGIRISHNKIHRFLLENGLSKIEPKKSKRRKWIRYERKHSNSLWHTDYHEMNNPVLEGKQLIPYEDDASRLITGYGLFDNATTRNALDTFRRAVD
jgi:putative transposase